MALGFEPDLTTYTKNDINGRFQNIVPRSADVVALRRGDIPANLGKSYAPGFFGDLGPNGLRGKVPITAISGNATDLYACILSNVANKDADYYSGAAADKEAITLSAGRSNVGVDRFLLFYWKTDGTFIADSFNTALVGNDFWYEILRPPPLTTVTVNLYSADTFDVGDLLDTLVLAATPATTFSKHYAAAGPGTSGTTTISGSSKDIDFTWVSEAANNPLISPIFGERGVLAA